MSPELRRTGGGGGFLFLPPEGGETRRGLGGAPLVYQKKPGSRERGTLRPSFDVANGALDASGRRFTARSQHGGENSDSGVISDPA